MEIAAGEAEAAAAIRTLEGPDNGFSPASMGFGMLGLAAAIGHLSREEGRDAFFGKVEIIEPAVLQQLEGFHAAGDGVRADGVEFHVPVAAAADVRLEGGTEPLFKGSREIRRAVHRLMQHDETCSGICQRLHLRPTLRREEGQLRAAIHEKDHGTGTIEHRLVFRPTIRHHHRSHARHRRQPFAEQGASGEVFVLPRLVARTAREQHDLRSTRIARHHLQRHLLLLGGEFSMERNNSEQGKKKRLHGRRDYFW